MSEVVLKEKEVKSKVVIKALKSIEATRGVITPHDVIEEAKAEGSPLHKYFEWDDKRGAHRYRLIQARILLNSVRVEFMGESREAYLNVITNVESVPMRGYVSLERVLSNEELHKQVIAEAVRELEHWTKKYDTLRELQGVVDPNMLRIIKEEVLE